MRNLGRVGGARIVIGLALLAGALGLAVPLRGGPPEAALLPAAPLAIAAVAAYGLYRIGRRLRPPDDLDDE